mmetsp:Transcript_26814/g.58438  ORF Transcript_26814/g.58438 Transcript_26814/m.58438 type:complete len:174 (+) Transcript_26814:204-725(+)
MSFLFQNFPVRLLKVAGGMVAMGLAGRAAKPFVLRFLTDRAFDKIDSNKNGKLDELELQLAIYEVYNLLNKRFPGWSDPPDRAFVLDCLKKFDENNDKTLDKAEFNKFILYVLQEGPQNFYKRIAGDVTAKAGILPTATPVLKKALGLDLVPDAVLAPIIGQASNTLTGFGPK